MKKVILLTILLLSLLIISSCNKTSDTLTNESDNPLNNNPVMRQTEIIDDENRSLIGTSIQDHSMLSKSANISDTTTSNVDDNTDLSVLKNPLVNELASQDMIPPNSITEFEAKDNIIPEISMTNGNAAIFTKNDHQGWTCKEGDSLVYEFEKYPSEVIDSQTIIVGYVLNGVLYPGESFRDLTGTYQLDIIEEGNYLIYVISATSDYLALKQGTISIVSN